MVSDVCVADGPCRKAARYSMFNRNGRIGQAISATMIQEDMWVRNELLGKSYYVRGGCAVRNNGFSRCISALRRIGRAPKSSGLLPETSVVARDALEVRPYEAL